ncbi:MAG: Ku protein [Actinobacteria bacterium]|nr:Ku protein [Actinomycetota bacterium]
MARATWSGFVSFGLVNVPVKLFTVVRSHDVNFKQIHATTHARVKRKRVDEETGEEVPYDEIVKGYEVGEDRYVIVDPDELEQLDPETSRMIDIRDFVDLSEIDPIYYDRPYYLAPDGEAALKPYRLLTEAMERSGRVGIAKFVMRNKEYLAALRPRDGVLLLSTMNYADEVADPEELDVGSFGQDVEVRERELEMAEQLIDRLVTQFDPSAYHDEYQQRLIEFLEAKAEGEEVEITPPERDVGGVVDLMAALEESLQRSRGDRRAAASGDGSYTDLTRDELYDLAQQRDISGRSSMSKDELIDALRETDTRAGAA